MNRNKGNALKVAIEDLSTNERIAWEHRLAGASAADAADAMGRDVKHVRALWRNARARSRPSKSGRFDFALAIAGRCKCGLLNPCHNCGPTAAELATARIGDGEARGPAPASHGGNARTGAVCR